MRRLLIVAVGLVATLGGMVPAQADNKEVPDPDDRGPGMTLDIASFGHGHSFLFGTRMLGHTIVFHDPVSEGEFEYLEGESGGDRGIILRFSTDRDGAPERELRFYSTGDTYEAYIFNMTGKFRGFAHWARGTPRSIAFSFQRRSLKPGLRRYTWWVITEDLGGCDDTGEGEPVDPDKKCVDRTERLVHKLGK